MEVVEECGPQWCNLPLPLLESSFKKLFPNSLASLASAQATCRAFSVAVIEVLKNVEKVDVSHRALSTDDGKDPKQKSQWLLQKLTGLKRALCNQGTLKCFPLPCESQWGSRLTELQLFHSNFSDREMQVLFSGNENKSSMPFLQVLFLDSSSAYLSGEGWLSNNLLPSLKNLSTAWCHGMTDNGLSDIAGQLTALNVHGCGKVGDAVCKKLKLVKELDMSFTSITDRGLHSLVPCNALRYLVLTEDHANIWVCKYWSTGGLQFLRTMRADIAIKLVSC